MTFFCLVKNKVLFFDSNAATLSNLPSLQPIHYFLRFSTPKTLEKVN